MTTNQNITTDYIAKYNHLLKGRSVVPKSEEASFGHDTIFQEPVNFLDLGKEQKEEGRPQITFPNQNIVDHNFQNNFLLYKSINSASEDFCWFGQYGKKLYLAIVTSIGYRLLGAKLSDIGKSILDKIILQENTTLPSEILEKMDFYLKVLLAQYGTMNVDGMYVSLCAIEYLNNNKVYMQFSGAKNPIYYFSSQDSKVYHLKANKRTIGYQNVGDKKFTNQELVLNKYDSIYLASNGFIDQTSPKKARFGKKRFMALLEKTAIEPMETQKNMLADAHTIFRSSIGQQNDVSVLGIQI